MDDIAPAYKAMRLWGCYEALVEAKNNKFKNPDRFIMSILTYESQHEDGVYNETQAKKLVQTMG